MSNSHKLGIGNGVQKETVIFHGGIHSHDSFGRITDLVVAWTKKVHQLSQKSSGDLRLLIQGLLEFSFPKDKVSTGHLELAIENQQVYVGLRFDNFIITEGDDVEKKLSQYWLNSEESTTVKKILNPQDHVEVLYMQKGNLLEWRIVRPLGSVTLNPDQRSFQVFTDIESSFVTDHEEFIEIGDVPYEEWLTQVFTNDHEKNKSGDFLVNGQSVQNEDEWSRVAFEREKNEIDDSVARFHAS